MQWFCVRQHLSICTHFRRAVSYRSVYGLSFQIRREAQTDVGSKRMVSQLAMQYTRSLVRNVTDSVNKFKSVFGCLTSS